MVLRRGLVVGENVHGVFQSRVQPFIDREGFGGSVMENLFLLPFFRHD